MLPYFSASTPLKSRRRTRKNMDFYLLTQSLMDGFSPRPGPDRALLHVGKRLTKFRVDATGIKYWPVPSAGILHSFKITRPPLPSHNNQHNFIFREVSLLPSPSFWSGEIITTYLFSLAPQGLRLWLLSSQEGGYPPKIGSYFFK